MGFPTNVILLTGRARTASRMGSPDECQLGGEATIAIVILTDNLGIETTWQLWEQGSDLVASGGPYESATLYEHSITVDSAYLL